MSEIELGSPGSSPEVTPSLQSLVKGSPTARNPSPRTVPPMSGTRLNERDVAVTVDNQDTSSVDAQKELKSLLNEKGKEKISSFRAFWEALKQLMSKGGWNFGQAKLNLVVKDHMLQNPSCMKQWAAEIVSTIETLDPSAVKAYINALSQIPKNSGENNPDEVLKQLEDGILARMSSGIKSNNIKCFIDNAHHVIHSSPGSITDDSNRTLHQSIDILRKHKIDFMRLIPDKTITGKVFDFIGQLYFRGQYKEISYLPSTTEESAQGRKIDLSWTNMYTIITFMVNHPDSQILSNLLKLICLANAAPSAFEALTSDPKPFGQNVLTFIENLSFNGKKVSYKPEDNESPIEIADPQRIMQLMNVLEKASVANVKVDVKKLVMLANAAPSALNTLAYDPKPPSPNVLTFIKNLSFEGRKVFYKPESGDAIEIADPQQIMQLMKVLEKAPEVDVKKLMMLASAAPLAFKTLAWDPKLLSSNVLTFIEKLSFDGGKVSYKPEGDGSSIEIANPQLIVQLMKVLEKASEVDVKVDVKKLVMLANTMPSALDTLASDPKQPSQNFSTFIGKLSFDSQKVSYHLEDESSIEIVSHNADHQQMVELIRVLNVTGEVKAMDELVKFAKNKPQALKMLANSSEKTRLVLLSHMATLNKITDDDTARTFLAICCVMAGGEMKATDASNAVLEELMNFVSNYQAPQATNSDPKAFLSALRKFVDSKDITIVYNDENIAQIVQSKWNLQKNNGTNEINLSALVEFATNNLESLDTLAQMVQFVMKLQENNETDKINEINTHALADFATNYPKSFDKLAQYDKPIPPGFLTAFLESEVWDKIFEELGKWKNLDELEGEKFLAEYAKLEKESDRELASILANTLHSIEVTRDENLGTIDSSTWIEYFETDIRSSFPGVTWWKISWDR